jgi:hypothetical protein
MNSQEEIFKVGQEIISVQYDTEGLDEYTWFFGGYLSDETIAINVVSISCNSQFYIRVKVGDVITFPELIFEDKANLKFKVASLNPEQNEIGLIEG